jgi:hypothetical protein
MTRLAFICMPFLAGLSLVANAAAPALQASEEIVKTRDSCGLVIDKTLPTAPARREAIARLAWGGACVEGLAMGEGVILAGEKPDGQPARLPMRARAWYGRVVGEHAQRWDNGRSLEFFASEGRAVTRGMAGRPVWTADRTAASLVSDGEVTVMTTLINGAPGVFVVDPRTRSYMPHACPGAGQGECEALWERHAGPVMARARDFIARHESQAQLRLREADVLAAKWRAQIGSAEADKREKQAMQEGVDIAARPAPGPVQPRRAVDVDRPAVAAAAPASSATSPEPCERYLREFRAIAEWEEEHALALNNKADAKARAGYRQNRDGKIKGMEDQATNLRRLLRSTESSALNHMPTLQLHTRESLLKNVTSAWQGGGTSQAQGKFVECMYDLARVKQGLPSMGEIPEGYSFVPPPSQPSGVCPPGWDRLPMPENVVPKVKGYRKSFCKLTRR